MNYPKGSKPKIDSSLIKDSKNHVRPKIKTGNRGMDFEHAINLSNEYYSEKGMALITKRPTPINVVSVDYSKGAIITKAYFEKQSTTDYNGIYKGKYVDFEAKSTLSKTSFPLHNIPPQQIEHLKKVISQDGIAFFLIRLVSRNSTYLLSAKFIISFYNSRSRASIPLEGIIENGVLVEEGYNPPYDYLKAVDLAFFK